MVTGEGGGDIGTCLPKVDVCNNNMYNNNKSGRMERMIRAYKVFCFKPSAHLPDWPEGAEDFSTVNIAA